MRKKAMRPIAKPALYPWPRPICDVFVTKGVVVPYNGKIVQTPHRHAVVAVGQNACIKVMQAKFADRLEGIGLPWISAKAIIGGVGIGVAPKVTANGYIPFTPFAKAGARTGVWVAFLDEEHLKALDSTEPGYTRLKLSSSKYPLTLARDGQRIEEYFIYQADKGYMTDGLSALEAPITQKQIFEFLQNVTDIAQVLPKQYRHSYLAQDQRKINDRIARNSWMIREPNLEGEKCE